MSRNERPNLPPLSGDPSISGDAILEEGESLRMLHDLMLVKRYEGDTTYGGGTLVIADKYREPSCHGTVLAVGEGAQKTDKKGNPTGEREEMIVKEGDVIMYDGSTGINTREYRKGSGIVVLAQRDVLFIARENIEEEELSLLELHEPGGEFCGGPDKEDYWPVGKHLPKWLRDRLEECNNEDIRISLEDERSDGW